MFEREVDITGEPVICQKWWNIGRTRRCEAAVIHRLDADLELCVCKHCGQTWMCDVSPFDKLVESLERLKIANAQLTIAIDSMKKNYERLGKQLEATVIAGKWTL